VDPPDSCRISVPGSTQVPDGRDSIFAYGTVTLFGRLSHTILLIESFVTPMCLALQPRPSKLGWFGLFPFRSPLLGELFLFLWVLRCFSSPGALRQPIYSDGDAVGSRQRVSPFGNPRIGACSRLPEAYRSDPRPSSALGAKASTVNP
jgi:hypothetical protein